jgi:8-oxo-dGTP pyrophosphatase MutT (NUDIX family)
MKTLITFDRKNYNFLSPRIIDNSMRAIITKYGKIGMVYSKRYEFYCFPGGRVEKGESKIEALIRETKEEAGLSIKPESIKEFGIITEIRKDLFIDGIYERHDFYYYCDVEDILIEPKLTKQEINAGYEFGFISIDDAITKNELELHFGGKFSEAETYVLKLLRNQL